MTSHAAARWVAAIFVIAATATVPARQVVRSGGPPPEIRALFDAFTTAFNSGSADAWEAFVQARFAPALLEKYSKEQRDEMYRRLAGDFGTIAIGRVTREGPDAPMQLNVKGSKGSGVFTLGVDASNPPRIVSFGVEAGDRDPATPGVPLPQLDRTLTSDEVNHRLDGYFTKLAQDDVFSGVALVARNGVPVFMKAYGMADREKKIANTIRTRFNIGSINKEFTQTAIRQLIREGKLSPDDALGKFFPDYPQTASRDATVQQLLTHRAGLSDFFGPQFNAAPKDRFASNADYFKFVSSLPPNFSPGERSQYCNGCYIALGAIVEKVSGMPYEQFVAQHIFARAEMTSTGYPRSDRPADDIAIGYTRRGASQGLSRNSTMHGVTGSAAGGGYSTALDLLTYVKAVRAGRFPDREPDLGIAGGAPGTNAIVEARGEWVV
ncbi:MAG TPA: serine hydrolase domain-containing protein, partial [Vicinamibacterales bacterium]